MTDWKPGDRCRVVEHDDATRRPKEGGRVLPATVTRLAGRYVIALPEHEDGSLGPDAQFWAESGWTAWDGEFRWRLMAAEDAATAAGEGSS